MSSLLYYALIGIAAGYIGGQIMKGRGFGLVGNLIVGLIGGVLGGWLLNTLGFYGGSGIIPSLITSVIGAVTLLFIVGLVKKNT
ncbi:MAG: GlsB/YeaQ/YmgE family stress response membrane protein [Bacteroidia bacterium]